MRYAIISDIHANAAALRTVLADAGDLGAEKIVCLGDVLGYGPEPVEALESVYAHAHVCLAGNHDDAVCGRCGTEDFNDFAAAAVARQRKGLTADALSWLGKLPYCCALGDFACAHGDFTRPEAFNYILEPADAEPSLAVRPEALLFVGHTHEPAIFRRAPDGMVARFEPTDFRLEDGCRYVVNVGSVGYPRSGVCRSSYCLYDDAARTVHFRSLPFDLEGYRAKMGGKGLDEAPWLAARAAARAQPVVRAATKFGKTVPKKKVMVGQPVVAAPRPAKKSLAPLVVLAVVALAAIGGVVALRWRGGKVAPPQVVVREKVVTRTVVKEVPPAPEVLAAAARAADLPPLAQPLTNCAVRLGDCDRKLYLAVRLSPKSNPVKVRLVFRDAKGKPLPGAEITYPTVDRTLMRNTARSAVTVPEGAASAVLEAGKAAGIGFCEFFQFELAVQEIKAGKRRR